MDRFPPAQDGPRYEMQAIQRSLNDLARPRGALPASRDIWNAIVLAAAGLLLVVAFVAWLFATSPVHA